jgi:hypothetical protein
VKPEMVNATLDESTLDAAVGWIERRFPGNPEDSLRRAVALVYRAILTLLAEPWHGRLSEPGKFRLPVEALAKRVRGLSPSRPKPRYIDPTEVQACVDALVDAGALVIVAAGNPDGRGPKVRAPVIAVAQPPSKEKTCGRNHAPTAGAAN